MNILLNTDIQVGDIRICSYEGAGLHPGMLVEIVKAHQANSGTYWHLRICKTNELWVNNSWGDGRFEDSYVDPSIIEELVSRVDEEYEVCD